ncbi:MAG: YggS family pyridoxal phosphate-dependent enzyme [Acidaminococcaceae bacterium]|nr:YggS family pyridoxal phosphate-dependent enzyme [Acidaminococcaceae bacterium]
MEESVLIKIKDDISTALGKRQKQFVTGNRVEILAVTKNHPPKLIVDAFNSGLTQVGENRVQEALHKQAVIDNKDIQWHLIGHLQTNKARQAVGIFDIIESVDSLRLLELLDKEAQHINKVQKILLQINIAEEPQKTGFSVGDYETAVTKIDNFPNLSLQGLMVIAPQTDDTEKIRSVFRKGYEFFAKLKEVQPVSILSMGMSEDFSIAIEEGANQVRLGSALFGARDYSLKF